MDKLQEGSSESVHSVHSQDTELIDEATSSFDVTQNASTTTLSTSNSLCVNAGSPRDHSLLDFCPSLNDTATTACSTPHDHDGKLATAIKRRYTSSSDDQITIKKQKTIQEFLESSDIGKDTQTSRSLDSESSHEELPSVAKSKLVTTTLKNPIIEYAEANSSVSPSEKLISNSSAVMVKKQRSPDYLRPKANNNIKTLTEEYQDSDDISILKQTLAKLRNENLRLNKENQSFRNVLRCQKTKGKEKEDLNGKYFTERVTCSVSYFYDYIRDEITLISINQMSKQDLFFDSKQPRLSLSSGSLADSSGSEGTFDNQIPRASSFVSSSSSTVSSSTSSTRLDDRTQINNRFRVPRIPELKKQLYYKYPKTCVCQCFCTHFVDVLSKSVSRDITSESSSSSEFIKPEPKDLTTSSTHLAEDLTTTYHTVQQNGKGEIINEESPENRCLEFKSRASIYIPASNNLPVFAMWPSNSYCYPGIVENANENTWNTSTHLEVKFCDGTVKKILSDNLFPAYLLPSGTEISYEKDDVCETAVLISLERLVNNELVCLGESKKGIGERVNIPFEKIFLSDYCYKGLKKEMSASITPKQTPRFSVSTANVKEGKRTRKLVKFENSSPLPSGSTGRKTRASKGKGAQSTTGSSSDTSRAKKRLRTLSQRKQEQKANNENATPSAHSGTKKQVVRKLYDETPSCSKQTQNRDSFEKQDAMSGTDTDSSIQREVNIDEVTGHNLDDECLPEVSLRHYKQKKTLLKKNNVSRDDKIKGPIPDRNIFSGYNFVFTRANPKENPVPKTKYDSYSDEGSSTDNESYLVCSIPFDYLRLREQVTSGGGRVYRSILHIPTEEYKKTILITDKIVETPNYLLAVSLGIPVYRYDLIVDCCLKRKTVAELIDNEMKMPCGRSLDTGKWVDTRTSGSPLKGHCCILSLFANKSTLNFWWYILTNAGAKVINNQIPLRVFSGIDASISFIVGDESLSEDILLEAKSNGIPVVSTLWVTQTIIHGKQMLFDSHPEFTITSSNT